MGVTDDCIVFCSVSTSPTCVSWVEIIMYLFYFMMFEVRIYGDLRL